MSVFTECPSCRTPIAYGNRKQCSGCGLIFPTTAEIAAAEVQAAVMKSYTGPVEFGHPEDTQNNIEGVNTSNWPSALQPIRPIGNKGAEPLIINYQMGPEDTASAPTPIRQTPIKPAFPNPPARNR